MRFVAANQWWPNPPSDRPGVTLRRDNWDDYTFKTMWNVRLWLSSGREVELGYVKVLQRGQSEGRTPLPDAFERLSVDFCSLGQAPSYYETLRQADHDEPGVAEAYLTAMRDAAFDPAIRAEFEDEPGFQNSLLRESAASEALERGRAIVSDEDGASALRELRLRFSMPGLYEPLELLFGDSVELPSRIYALIGYNGVGKTRLLANVGMVAASDRRRQAQPNFREQYGSFEEQPPDVSAVICVSYSAFDRFPIPGDGDSHLGLAYTYIGLRKTDRDPGPTETIELKRMDEIEAEFHQARESAVAKMREDQLESIFAPLFFEPSFSMAGDLPELDADRAEWENAIGKLSTGHMIVLNVLVQLCARLEQRSLVLIDEPEMHLHPPLVAALLTSIQIGLRTYDSYAVVATHSPVVAQEVPAEKVFMLRRATSVSRAERPEIETFGENISLLTDRIFHLDNSRSDYRRVLLELVENRSPEEVAELFPNGPSAQAWAILVSETARREQD